MRALLLLLVFVAIPATGWTQEKPLERAELDKRLAKIVNQAAVRGSDTFNTGNHEGCYRLYQGTLMAVLPLLDHRPKLAESVAVALDRSGRVRPAEGAFILRESIDAVQKELTAEPMAVVPPPPPAKKLLWERIGGMPTARAVVHDFVIAASTDPKVNFTRGGQFKLDAAEMTRIEGIMLSAFTELAGGPAQPELAGLPAKVLALKITGPEYDAASGQLVAAMEKNKVGAGEIEDVKNLLAVLKPQIVK